ncbi:MAG: YcfL family protein [Phycisphaerales bacterium]|nr:MAG: YcfL family protein [Phycisphaerales bacterium]
MKRLGPILIALVVVACGCYKQQDSRIHLREGIRSDTLDGNIVTRPVGRAFSDLIGEGLEITHAITSRNDAGLLELQVQGYNRSHRTKRFRYRVEWLDESGLLVTTKTSVWLRMSAMGKSPFIFKVVAPRPEAVDFRLDTRKWE